VVNPTRLATTRRNFGQRQHQQASGDPFDELHRLKIPARAPPQRRMVYCAPFALGGHLWRCDQCSHEVFSYHILQKPILSPLMRGNLDLFPSSPVA
jgi:hypothetical protein